MQAHVLKIRPSIQGDQPGEKFVRVSLKAKQPTSDYLPM